MRLNEAELSPRFHQADAGPERALFRILGMIATCLGALSGQAPKPAGAAPLARGLDGESALRAIMANAMGRSSWNTTGTRLSRKSTLEQNTLQPLDNPVRPEVVTHVIGTFRYLCLRSGQAKCWSEWQDLNLRPPRPERGALPASAYVAQRRCQVAVWRDADALETEP